jgi:hypothetical protein
MNQPWWAFFDVDLFLDDLVSGETRLCSQLLANALLALASVSCSNAFIFSDSGPDASP